MGDFNEEIRIGICKHTGRKMLQIKDSNCDDAIDEKGWLCLHDETIEKEVENIMEFKYKIKQFIYLN